MRHARPSSAVLATVVEFAPPSWYIRLVLKEVYPFRNVPMELLPSSGTPSVEGARGAMFPSTVRASPPGGGKLLGSTPERRNAHNV